MIKLSIDLKNTARDLAEVIIPCIIVGVAATYFANKPIDNVIVRDAWAMCNRHEGLQEFQKKYFSYHKYDVRCKDGSMFPAVELRAMTMAEIKAQEEKYHKEQEQEQRRLEKHKEQLAKDKQPK